MTGRFFNKVASASMVVRACRGIACVVVRAARGTLAWWREVNQRISIGLQGSTGQPTTSDEQVEALIRDSRLVQAAAAVVAAPVNAWRTAYARRPVEGFLALDLPVRIRLIGCTLAVAVLTHTILMAAIGVEVFRIGWTFRGIVVFVALALIGCADAFAAAWKERVSR